MLTAIFKVFIALNSNKKPTELAYSIAFAFWLAMIPANNLIWFALFILTFFIKVNQAAILFFIFLFKLIIPVLDANINVFGSLILEQPSLFDFFTTLNNTPFVPWTNFNHSLVLGGLVLGIITFIPISLLTYLIVRLYHRHIRDRIVKLAFIKTISKLPLVQKIAKKYQEVGALYKAFK